MKHRKPETRENTEGHYVIIRDKGKIVSREHYPTYGKATWAVLAAEEKYPNYTVEYWDARSFKEDTYE